MSVFRLFAFMAFLVFFNVAQAQDINKIPRKITISTGAELVAIALGYPDHLPEPGAKDDSEMFLLYQLLGKYVGTAGWYAVNPWTGAVWDMLSCEELHTTKLSKKQNEIRMRFTHAEFKHYHDLGLLRPYRMSTLESCR